MAPPREAAFWMEGTYLPLDHDFHRTRPHRPPPCGQRRAVQHRTNIPSGGIVAGVLELKAGEAARIGLKPGDPRQTTRSTRRADRR